VWVRVPPLAPKKGEIVSNEAKKQTADSRLRFDIKYCSDTSCVVDIVVPKYVVRTLFDCIVQLQQPYVTAPGFLLGSVPLSYIAQEFRSTLLLFLKEFLLKFCVTNFLYGRIRDAKLILVGTPLLRDIRLHPDEDGIFSFDVTLFQPLAIQEWKLLPFKVPRRKNYRDIDRQVENFIKKETDFQANEFVEQGDWVYFSLTIVDQKGNPLLLDFSQYFWFRLHDEEVENVLQSQLFSKKVGDSFLLEKSVFYNAFTMHIDGVFPLYLRIEEIVHYKMLCFDRLKRHFRLKTQKDVFKKLIEVFSFRNDLSQRHAMVEEAFKLLLSKHRFVPPHPLVVQYEEEILAEIKKKLDYSVYKKEKKFGDYVRMLAEKQVREQLFSEMIGYTEDVTVFHDDVCNYLNLTNRQRTQQLLHFGLPQTKMNGQEIPVAEEYIKNNCFREKALNYIIYYLTK
jgi:FKBP-type peptidyl-prolyl cis-trans isomerase (trigger factor)